MATFRSAVVMLLLSGTAAFGEGASPGRSATLLPKGEGLASATTFTREELVTEQARLRADRPGFGLPIGLLVGGVLGLAAGFVLGFAGVMVTDGVGNPYLYAGLVLAPAGLLTTIVATLFFGLTGRWRAQTEARLDALGLELGRMEPTQAR